MSNQNKLEESLEKLSGGEPFAVFVAYVWQLRENAIGDLYRKDCDEKKIAGRIAAYDEILQRVSWTKHRTCLPQFFE